MGHSTRPNGIRDFSPDDTETCFYIASNSWTSLADILRKAKEKWGDDLDFSDIQISSEYIHTSCLSYNQYDPSDYTCFTVITYEPSPG